MVVVNKIDQLTQGQMQDSQGELYHRITELFPSISRDRIFPISCFEAADQSSTKEDPGNIQNLLQGLQCYFATLTTPLGPKEQDFDHAYWEQSLSVSHRQSGYLQQCLQHLDEFLPQGISQHHSDDHEDLVSETDIVVAAEHLRFAANCLAKITGRGEVGDVEEVLGVVFEK